jgi:hypothetical protein
MHCTTLDARADESREVSPAHFPFSVTSKLQTRVTPTRRPLRWPICRPRVWRCGRSALVSSRVVPLPPWLLAVGRTVELSQTPRQPVHGCGCGCTCTPPRSPLESKALGPPRIRDLDRDKITKRTPGPGSRPLSGQTRRPLRGPITCTSTETRNQVPGLVVLHRFPLTMTMHHAVLHPDEDLKGVANFSNVKHLQEMC